MIALTVRDTRGLGRECNAASGEAIATVTPNRSCSSHGGLIFPTPLTARPEVHVGLDSNPVCAGLEFDGGWKRHCETASAIVDAIDNQRGVESINGPSRLTALVIVDCHVLGTCRAGAVEVRAGWCCGPLKCSLRRTLRSLQLETSNCRNAVRF